MTDIDMEHMDDLTRARLRAEQAIEAMDQICALAKQICDVASGILRAREARDEQEK